MQEGESARVPPWYRFQIGQGGSRHSLQSRELSLSPCPHDLLRILGSAALLWVCGLANEGRPLGHFSAGAGLGHISGSSRILYPQFHSVKTEVVSVCAGKPQDTQKVDGEEPSKKKGLRSKQEDWQERKSEMNYLKCPNATAESNPIQQ